MTELDKTGLAPCPFCGAKNAMTFPPTCDRSSPYDPADRAAPMVRCMGCYAEAVGTDWDSTSKSAIAAWNRRASSTSAGVTEEQTGTFAGGLKAAVKFVRKRLDDYVAEHGMYDPETGATEFPGNGDETVCEWEEIIEGLEALKEIKP